MSSNILDLIRNYNPHYNILDVYPILHNRFIESFDRYNVSSYYDQNKQYYSIEVPGMSKDDLKVTLNNRYVKVVGERNNTSFTKGFTVDTNLNVDTINVDLEYGILTISFNKIEYNNDTDEKIIEIN